MQKCLTNSYIPSEPLHVAHSSLRTQGQATIKNSRNGSEARASPCAPKRPISATVPPPQVRFSRWSLAQGSACPNWLYSNSGEGRQDQQLAFALIHPRMGRVDEEISAIHIAKRYYFTYAGSIPGPSVYSPAMGNLKSKSMGGCIGTALRHSFIDSIRKSEISPGPGNYELPAEFGRYSRNSASSNKMHAEDWPTHLISIPSINKSTIHYSSTIIIPFVHAALFIFAILMLFRIFLKGNGLTTEASIRLASNQERILI